MKFLIEKNVILPPILLSNIVSKPEDKVLFKIEKKKNDIVGEGI